MTLFERSLCKNKQHELSLVRPSGLSFQGALGLRNCLLFLIQVMVLQLSSGAHTLQISILTHALAAREVAVVRSPQALPAVNCVGEQILVCLFHFRKEFNCLSLKDVHGKSINSTEICVVFGSAPSIAAIKIFLCNYMARNKFQ